MRRFSFLGALFLSACVSDTILPPDGGGTDAMTSDVGVDQSSGDGGGGGEGGDAAGVPLHPPSSIAFTDQDPTQGKVTGTVQIGKATDESDVTTYKLYWGTSPTTKLSSITNLPATGSNLTYMLTGTVPMGATHVLAFTANASGEMATGVAVGPVDNYPVYKDISAGQGTNCGNNPFALIDTTNKKLLVVTADGDNLGKPALFRCDLDGSNCAYKDLSANQGSGSGSYPSAVIDTLNNKLLVVTQNSANSNKPEVFVCNLDGSSCQPQDISAGQGAYSGRYPSAVIDTANNKLLVVTQNDANSQKPGLFICNLNGTGCTYADVSAGQGASSGTFPSAVIVGGKLRFVTQNQANSSKPGLFVCDLNGTNCTHTDISVGQGTNSGKFPSLVVDVAGSKLLTVTDNVANNDKPALFRTAFDGTGAMYADISGGAPAFSAYYVHAMLDAAGSKLYTVTQDDSNNTKPTLFRCNLDGTGCSYIDMSAGQGANSGYYVTGVIDAVNKKVLVVTGDASNSNKLSLFSLSLW